MLDIRDLGLVEEGGQSDELCDFMQSFPKKYCFVRCLHYEKSCACEKPA